VLAVLCDFGGREPGEVVGYIVRRLHELLADDERRFREYMTMLEILSDNRALRAQVEEAERMLTEVDIERLPSFVIGFERGETRGEERGEARGRAEGKAEGEVEGREAAIQEIVKRLLTRMEAPQVAELLGLELETVRRLAGADPSAR
jgi:predicted transposase YdaD